MTYLQLSFNEPSPADTKGSADIVLVAPFVSTAHGADAIVAGCGSVEELEDFVNLIRHDLERILKQAQTRFAQHADQLFDPFAEAK